MVAFNLGVAELWAGDPKDAQADLRHAKQLDPYGFYGERADNALHYNMPRGYPCYFPPTTPADTAVGGRAARRRQGQPAATRRPGCSWRSSSSSSTAGEAIEAARKAVEASPTAVSPRVALAVLTFDKDHPAASMGQLGPMLQQQECEHRDPFPRRPAGLWLGSTTQALGEFRQVLREDPHGPYSPSCRDQLIDKLDSLSSR